MDECAQRIPAWDRSPCIIDIGTDASPPETASGSKRQCASYQQKRKIATHSMDRICPSKFAQLYDFPLKVDKTKCKPFWARWH